MQMVVVNRFVAMAPVPEEVVEQARCLEYF